MKSPIAALILAKSKSKSSDSEKPETPTEGGEENSELEMAGSDCIDAIKSGDAKAFTEALKNFLALHENSEEEAPESSGAEMGEEEIA